MTPVSVVEKVQILGGCIPSIFPRMEPDMRLGLGCYKLLIRISMLVLFIIEKLSYFNCALVPFVRKVRNFDICYTNLVKLILLPFICIYTCIAATGGYTYFIKLKERIWSFKSQWRHIHRNNNNYWTRPGCTKFIPYILHSIE